MKTSSEVTARSYEIALRRRECIDGKTKLLKTREDFRELDPVYVRELEGRIRKQTMLLGHMRIPT